MAFDPFLVLGAMGLYMGLLFAVALWAERRAALGANPSNHPLVYALSLAVYCTAWTFYGSVGKAAVSGMSFLAVYLGPTLGMLFWGRVLPRLVEIKQVHRVTSIADLVSLRYGKSQGLGALATLVLLVGIVPYLGLQLKSLVQTFQILTAAWPASQGPEVGQHLGGLMAGLMVIFTIVFGTRRLDPTERHQGMVLAVALESLVKLLAFLAVGFFVVYHLHGGLGPLWRRFQAQEAMAGLMGLGQGADGGYLNWLSQVLLGMLAVVLLPRQFQVAVVENFDPRHVGTATWAFPVYLALINLFVAPLAMAGLLAGHPAALADTFVLRLPLENGASWLSLLVFLGGFSASTAMVMVATMALSTMSVNHLALPILERVPLLAPLRRRLLGLRWLATAVIIANAWWFEQALGGRRLLADTGLISFAAIAQMAVPVLGGLYWRRGSRAGACLGLLGGFAVWVYTAVLPLWAGAAWLDPSLLSQGPWGLKLFLPQRLLGIAAFDPLTNTVFWSLAANLGLYVLGSLLWGQDPAQQRLAWEWSGLGLETAPAPEAGPEPAATVPLAAKRELLESMLLDYLPPERAQALLGQALQELGLESASLVTALQLAELCRLLENSLSGSIGAASAAAALGRLPLFGPQEDQALRAAYAGMLASLKVSPQELRRKIDYYHEKEALLRRESDLLHQSRRLLEDKLESLDRLARSIAHEIRNPITAIGGLTQRLIRQGEAQGRENEYLTKILSGVRSLERMVSEVRAYADLPVPSLVEEDLGPLLGRVAKGYAPAAGAAGVELALTGLAGQVGRARAWVDPVLLERAVKVMVDNALEAMPHGGRLSLDLACDGETAVISVADTGAGISPQDMPYLFDPLFSTKADAVGMNLAIARRIASEHGGELHAESTPGQGAVFRLSLPCKPVSMAQLRAWA